MKAREKLIKIDPSSIPVLHSKRLKKNAQPRLVTLYRTLYSCRKPTVNVCTIIVYTIDTIINRRYRELRERLVDAMVAVMLRKKPGHPENINSGHRLKMLLNQFTVSTAREQ